RRERGADDRSASVETDEDVEVGDIDQLAEEPGVVRRHELVPMPEPTPDERLGRDAGDPAPEPLAARSRQPGGIEPAEPRRHAREEGGPGPGHRPLPARLRAPRGRP